MSSLLRRFGRASRPSRPFQHHITALVMLEAVSREELEELHRLILATHARYCPECRVRPGQHVKLEAPLW